MHGFKRRAILLAASQLLLGAAPVFSAETTSHKYYRRIEPTFKNLAYADKSPAENLDLYLPAPANSPAPLVIWIHGGGFAVGDKLSMQYQYFGPPPARPAGPNGPYQIQVPDVTVLKAKGYAVVSLNYRLQRSPPPALGDQASILRYVKEIQPEMRLAVQDGKAAVRFLRANAVKYGIDPDKFAVWGNSAGGYIAAMLGVTGDQATIFDDPTLGNPGVSSAVQAVVDWFGALDLMPDRSLLVSTYIPTAKKLPPFNIANGDADLLIPLAMAQRLQATLVKGGTYSTLTVLKGAGHEDPAYRRNQMLPTFAFLDKIFGR